MTHEDPLFVAAQIANIIDTTSESFGIERTISNILVDPFVYAEDDYGRGDVNLPIDIHNHNDVNIMRFYL